MPPIVKELQSRPMVLHSIALGLALATKAHPWFLVFVVPVVILGSGWTARVVSMSLAVVGILLAPGQVQSLMERQYVDRSMDIVTVPRTGKSGDWCIAEGGGTRLGLFLGNSGTQLSLGDRIHLKGVVRTLKEGSEQFWLSKGVVGTMFIGRDNSIVVTQQGSPIFRWGMSWRQSFIDFAGANLSKRHAALADALCFNLDALLDKDLQDNLARTGTVHIVSASGLHVMIFAVAFQLVLSKLPIPRWAQLIVLLFFLLVYAGATGFRPPVLRAVVMVGVMMSAYLVRREGDLLSAAGLAAIAQFFLDPRSVFDIGFYLSFITVSALALFLPLDAPRWGKEAVIRSAQASFVASLASAPIVSHVFGRFSLVSILANLAIGISIAPIVAGGLGAWALHFVWPAGAGAIMNYGVSPFCSYLEWVVNMMGRLPFASLETPSFSAYWIPAFYVASLLLWRFKRRSAE
ncbi:MAG: ComEC/Rec2 family competence protein [Fimbriimonadaceae bacterium]